MLVKKWYLLRQNEVGCNCWLFVESSATRVKISAQAHTGWRTLSTSRCTLLGSWICRGDNYKQPVVGLRPLPCVRLHGTLQKGTKNSAKCAKCAKMWQMCTAHTGEHWKLEWAQLTTINNSQPLPVYDYVAFWRRKNLHSTHWALECVGVVTIINRDSLPVYNYVALFAKQQKSPHTGLLTTINNRQLRGTLCKNNTRGGEQWTGNCRDVHIRKCRWGRQ